MSRLTAEQLAHNKHAILKALAQHGLAYVVAEYSGYEDSTDGFEISTAPNGPALPEVSVTVVEVDSQWDEVAGKVEERIVEKERPLADAIESFAWEIIDRHHSGFQNNEGGRGTLTLDVEAWGWSLDHEDFVTESVQSFCQG
jgi:hypothetical protein